MAAHVRLKNEFTEDEKNHNLMSWLEYLSDSMVRKLYPLVPWLLVPVLEMKTKMIRAATRQNQQNECAPSEGSDQPGHLPSLIRVFAVRMKKAWVHSYPLSAQRRLIRLGGCQGWSESSLGAQSLCWVCHVAAHNKKKKRCISKTNVKTTIDV